MATEDYQNIYLYKRVVQAKLFIESNFADKIDLDNISNKQVSKNRVFNFVVFQCIDLNATHEELKAKGITFKNR